MTTTQLPSNPPTHYLPRSARRARGRARTASTLRDRLESRSDAATVAAYKLRIDRGESGHLIALEIGNDLRELDWQLVELRADRFPESTLAVMEQRRDELGSIRSALENLRSIAVADVVELAARAMTNHEREVRECVSDLERAVERAASQRVRAHDELGLARLLFDRVVAAITQPRAYAAGYWFHPTFLYGIEAIHRADTYHRQAEDLMVSLAAKLPVATASAIVAGATKIRVAMDALSRNYVLAADLFAKVRFGLDRFAVELP